MNNETPQSYAEKIVEQCRPYAKALQINDKPSYNDYWEEETKNATILVVFMTGTNFLNSPLPQTPK